MNSLRLRSRGFIIQPCRLFSTNPVEPSPAPVEPPPVARRGFGLASYVFGALTIGVVCYVGWRVTNKHPSVIDLPPMPSKTPDGKPIYETETIK